MNLIIAESGESRFVMSAVLLFIMVQQVLQAELGIISLRSDDFFDINVHNPSLIWGPGTKKLQESSRYLLLIFLPRFLLESLKVKLSIGHSFGCYLS